MRRIFIRAIVINAVVQFAVTRYRAGHAIEEGAAEMMWVRYPVTVLMNALAWTLMLSMFRGTLGLLRGRR
jgi:hypothetical protein